MTTKAKQRTSAEIQARRQEIAGIFREAVIAETLPNFRELDAEANALVLEHREALKREARENREPRYKRVGQR